MKGEPWQEIPHTSLRVLVAREWAAMHPATFFIPGNDEIAALAPGDFIKAVIDMRARDDDDFGIPERLWFLIKRIEGARFVCRLSNTPVHVEMDGRRSWRFAAEHVIDFTKAKQPSKKRRAA